MSLDPRSVARALGGVVNGRTVSAPGPNHSRTDRSLAVRIDSSAPDGFLVYSHCGDDWRTCRDYVRRRLGLPDWQPGDEQSRTIPPSKTYKWDMAAIERESEMHNEYSEDDLLRIERAVSLWNEGHDPRKTIAASYLRARCLDLTDDIAGNVLRFHPACPWRDENTGKTVFIPALVAAFRNDTTDQITAVHRIRLDQPERWPKTERRMFGIVARAAVKLTGVADATLAIGEGVETCMAARQLGLASVWALGSVGAISWFPILPDISTLIILRETGKASREATKICTERWRRAGKRVKIADPDIGSDLNDALMAASR